MKLGLILSNDWELFGLGTGDFYELQYKPLYDILNVLNAYGAKITFMAEVGQQWAHIKAGSEHQWAAQIAQDWEGALRHVITVGSDVQLHLHENWLKASYENDRWILDKGRWNVTGIIPESGENAFKKGKEYLESLLKPLDPSYECIVVRLGAFMIEPAETIIKKYKEAGLIIDTSVIKGYFSEGYYDHRKVHSQFVYMTSNDSLKNHGKNGIIELPIYSKIIKQPSFLSHHISEELFYKRYFNTNPSTEDMAWQTENRRISLERYPKINRLIAAPDYSNMSWIRRLTAIMRKWTAPRVITLCPDKLPPCVFVKILEDIMQDKQLLRKIGDKKLPIIALGHTKTMYNCDSIKRILEGIAGSKILRNKLEYWTFQEAAHYLLANGLPE